MARRPYTTSEIRCRISDLLSTYNNDLNSMREARYDIELTQQQRVQAQEDVRTYNRLSSLLRTRSVQEASAARASNSFNSSSTDGDSKLRTKISSKEPTVSVVAEKKASISSTVKRRRTSVLKTSSSKEKQYSDVSDVSSISSSDSSFVFVTENNNEDEGTLFCHNCHRIQNDSDDYYSLEYHLISSDVIMGRRNYCFLTKTYANEREVYFNVCSQCKSHLTERKIDIAHQSKYVFAAFMWKILSDDSMHSRLPGSFLWMLVPQEWRPWWFDMIVMLFPGVFNGITLYSPAPIIMDRTKDINDWKESISKYELSLLRDSCNKYLIPNVLCPFGCSEYIHRTGSLSFEGVLQRYLQVCDLHLRDITGFYKSLSAREDYFRRSIYEYDALLFNIDWRVLPSVAFINGVPSFLTCRFHDGGSNLKMVHVCRWKHCLPCKSSDQLAQAVVQPNSLRPMRTALFSNRFQMYEQRYSAKGVESINVSTRANFSHNSILLSESEARSLYNRTDITAHLTKLVDEKKLSSFQSDIMLKFASKYCANVDIFSLCVGGTYVPLEVAMLMQKEAKNREIIVFDHSRHESLRFNRIWCSYLYPCQTMHTYGANFYCPPSFCRHNDAGSMWQLCAMLLCVEPLWQLLATKDSYTVDCWYGHLLVYLSKNCIPSNKRRQQKKDCFKVGNSSFYELEEKFPNASDSFEQLFHEFSSIQCFEVEDYTDRDIILSLFQNDVQSQHTDIVILSNIDCSEMFVPQFINYPTCRYELVFLSSWWFDDDDQWDYVLTCRHGRHFTSWWSKRRDDEIFLKKGRNDDLQGDDFVGVFVKVTSPDFEYHKVELLKLLGGYGHVFCEEHRLPLVSSCRKMNCSCGKNKKREHVRCSVPNCDVGLCKTCLSSLDTDSVHFINQKSIDPNVSMSNEGMNNEDCEESSMPGLIEREGYDSDEELHDMPHLQERFSDDNSEDETFTGLPELKKSETCSDTSASSVEFNFLHNSGGNDRDDDDCYMMVDENLDFTEVPGVIWTDGPDAIVDELNCYEDDDFPFPLDTAGYENEIPTTDAGNDLLEIQEETAYGGVNNEFTIGGSGLLVEATSVLARKNHSISGSRYDKYFVQRFCSTTSGTSVPILWPESTMFPGIFYTDSFDRYSVVGALPSPLMSLSAPNEGFCSVPDHIRTRLTLPFSSTSTDPRYISYSYDLMGNLAANFNDTRMFSRHGLRAASDNVGGLEQRGINDSEMNNAVDSRQQVLNLCASLGYFEWDFFLTFTCNQKKHFGTSIIKEWIDSNNWKDEYPDYENMSNAHQNEIESALNQSSQGLLLRSWEEVSSLFIDLLKNSNKSPFFKTFALFARKEYQKDVGNLSHTHAMLKVNWESLSITEREFVHLLIRASICDVIRSDEVSHFIDENLIESHDDIQFIRDDVKRFLSHKCDSRCLVPTSTGKMRCRKLPSHNLSKDNTVDTFIELPRNFSSACIKRLIKCGLATGIYNEAGVIVDFKSDLSYFHPKRCLPRFSHDVETNNISPLEPCTFSVCRSMQNIQRLYGCGECCKYCCKYIGKIDEQNYLHVAVGKDGELIRQAHYLHNTKIVSSKIAQEKEREKDRKTKNKHQVHGRCISINEMYHHMLKYPDVYTDLEFKKVPTTALEFRIGIKLMLDRLQEKKKTTTVTNDDDQNNDESTITALSIKLREELFPGEEWRQVSDNQRVIMSDVKFRNTTRVDTITQFSLRPPELKYVCDMVGYYFRWFHVSNNCLKKKDVSNLLDDDMMHSAWIDILHCQIKLRKKALVEIYDWIRKIEKESQVPRIMISIICRLKTVYESTADLSLDDEQFLEFANKHLIHDDSGKHLPIPVYSFIKPTMGAQFLHHLLLSFGRFETELDLVFHSSIRKCFRYAKLIGNSDDPSDLEDYSNAMLNLFIRKQLCYYPNGQNIIDGWIVHTAELLDSTIIRGEIPVSVMPPVLASSLFTDHKDEYNRYLRSFKESMLNAALRELGDTTFYNIPSREQILSATLDNPIEWDALGCFLKSTNQSDESYEEQKRVIQLCLKQIDQYCNMKNAGVYTKNIIICGFPGGGKTFLLMYICVYSLCKGLYSISTAMMAHRAVQLGGIHWHKLLCIPTDDNLSITRRAELAVQKLQQKPKKMELLRRINIFFSDEKSQHSSEISHVFDLICRKIRLQNLLFGGILEICTMDNSQLQPVNGRPFLSSANVIPCYKMINICKSVRASGDEQFFRLQQLSRMNYSVFRDRPELIDEFKLLCNGFTFVDCWNDPLITPSTFRVYPKQVPAKEASRYFLSSVVLSISSNERSLAKSSDFEKRRQSRRDWVHASESTSNILESKVKEPRVLIFFKGAIFQCTYNHDEKFNQSQLCFCFDIPSQYDLDLFRPVKLLLFPTTLKFEDFVFNPSVSKEYYLALGFKEIHMGVSPSRIMYLTNDIQGKRRQYGLRHYVSGTIHSTMGDTYTTMATCVEEHKMWEKGQLVVICSRTRRMKDTIFVGNRERTISSLAKLLEKRTMWCDYVSQVMKIISVENQDESTERDRYLEHSAYPFNTSSISLPQAKTGYVFFMKSLKHESCIYIDITNCLRTRLIRHNAGYDSNKDPPPDKRPFVLLGYICGFDMKLDLMNYVKSEWITLSHYNSFEWVKNGQKVINSVIDSNQFGVEKTDLSLVCLFRDNTDAAA